MGPCSPQGAGLTAELEIRLWSYLHLGWLSRTGRARERLEGSERTSP